MGKIKIYLPDYLVDKLREKAKASGLSFCKYVKLCLFDIAYDEPNEETRKAMEDVKAGRGIESGVIDTSSVEAMLKSFGV